MGNMCFSDMGIVFLVWMCFLKIKILKVLKKMDVFYIVIRCNVFNFLNYYFGLGLVYFNF